MLPADKALHRADAHVVVPAADGEARYIHLVEKAGTVLPCPVGVVRRMLEPLAKQPAVVLGGAAERLHRLEPQGPSPAAGSVAFVKEAPPWSETALEHETRTPG